ncbi:MAG: FG-GAP-like repeat-containing protein [Candidatus Eisenbacteria bacterium]
MITVRLRGARAPGAACAALALGAARSALALGATRVSTLAAGLLVLLISLLLSSLLLRSPAYAQPLGGIETGRDSRESPTSPAGFSIDSQGRLLVIDHLRGFLVGRFRVPSGIVLGDAPGEGGIALDQSTVLGPSLPGVPLTTLVPQRGFPFMSSTPIAASPCAADFDRDGRVEIVIPGVDGTIDLISSTGRPAVGWPIRLAVECYAPPAAGDLDGDGALEIIVGGMSGEIFAFKPDGAAVEGWPVSLRAGESPALPIFAAPALADLDGDGADEVCAADASGAVWVLNGRGRVLEGWPRPTRRQPSDSTPVTLASPALADLDGSGGPEIVMGSHDGQIFAWNVSGQPVPGWPITLPDRLRAGFGDPAIGDVDGDGSLEVVVVAETDGDTPAAVIVLDATGRIAPGWPVALPDCCNAGAALGDLDEDGAADIVVATIGGNASVIAFDGRRAAPLTGWPVHFSNQTINASPLIADLDGDDRLDILVAALSTDLDTHTWLWAADSEGRELRAFPVFLPYDEIVRAAPLAVDLDGDGDVEILCGTEVLNSLHAWDLEAWCEPRLLPWPAQAGGPARTGCLEPDRGKPLASGGPAIDLSGAPDFGAPISLDPNPPAGTSLGAAPSGAPGLDLQAPPEGAAPGRTLATISFTLDAEGEVVLIVFDIQGAPVRRLLGHRLPPGQYSIFWDGKDDTGHARQSGIYFYRLRLGSRSTTRQLMLLK